MIDYDKLVLCAGSSTAPLLKKTLGLIVPQVGIKGYTMNVVAETASDLPVHDSIFFVGSNEWYFTTTPIEEGKVRVTSFGDVVEQENLEMDWGRVDQIKNSVQKRFIDPLGVKAHFENERCCLRPCTPDDQPIIGPLRSHPDIYLNTGYSGRGSLALSSSKIVSEMILDNEVSCLDFDEMKFGPKRFNL